MPGQQNFTFFLPKALLIFLILCHPVQALSIKDQRIKAYGIWKDNKLIVYKLKFRDRRVTSLGIISGRMSDFNRKEKKFRLGPYLITWNEKTKFRRLNPETLTNGYSVKINGKESKDGQFIATRIQPGSSDMAADTVKVLEPVQDLTLIVSFNNLKDER